VANNSFYFGTVKKRKNVEEGGGAIAKSYRRNG
jgi:hypothetical protein